MPIYRGVAVTGDIDNPRLATAACFLDERRATRAARKMAREGGYCVTKEGCYAEPVGEEEDGDEE